MQHCNSKIDVLESIFSQDADGHGSTKWTVKTGMSDVPCRIVWSRGREKIAFDKETHFRDAKILLDLRDIDQEDIVKYKDTYYDVQDAGNPDNANKFMVLDVKKRIAEVNKE